MKKELRARCWVDIDGKKFFGPGRVELLKQIDATGSIAEAARTMGMSYKKAWSMTEDMNAKATRPYVTVKKGGGKGGETHLTEAGKKLLNAFDTLNRELQSIIEQNHDLLQLV